MIAKLRLSSVDFVFSPDWLWSVNSTFSISFVVVFKNNFEAAIDVGLKIKAIITPNKRISIFLFLLLIFHYDKNLIKNIIE